MDNLKSKINLVLVSLLLTFTVNAANNKLIYNAYINNNMAEWQRVIDSLQHISHKHDSTRLELVNFQYGYIGWSLEHQSREKTNRYIHKAKHHMNVLERHGHLNAKIFAYKSAFIGFDIGLHPYKAPFIGPKSIEYAKKSIEVDTNNALGYLMMGNIDFYMPPAFGGSKELALEYYLKALTIAEQDEHCTNYNWNYLSLLASVIITYMALDDYVNAEKYCQKTLKIEPNFKWVKNELHPEVRKYL